MYAITAMAMAMRKFLAREKMEKVRKDRQEREHQALLALELIRIDEWMGQQGKIAK